MKTTLWLLLPFLLIACAKPDANNLEEKTAREIAVENESLAKRSETLEADLQRRQRFFSSLEGTFEGAFKVGNKTWMTSITFVPSLPPYDSARTRTLDEVTADLNNLYFTIQATHWTVETDSVVSGCIATPVKPDYDGGRLNAASDNCTNIYMISMYSSATPHGDLNAEKPGVPQKSQELAEKVLNKKLPRIDDIFVVMQPTLSEKSFLMVLKRVQK